MINFLIVDCTIIIMMIMMKRSNETILIHCFTRLLYSLLLASSSYLFAIPVSVHFLSFFGLCLVSSLRFPFFSYRVFSVLLSVSCLLLLSLFIFFSPSAAFPSIFLLSASPLLLEVIEPSDLFLQCLWCAVYLCM